MKNIFDLNKEIEAVVNPAIEFKHEHNNILFNCKWVNEIEQTFFPEWEDRIKEKIDLIINVESPFMIKTLKIFHQDILKKYKDLTEQNFNDLELLESKLSVYSYANQVEAPKEKSSCFYYIPEESHIYAERLEKFAQLNRIVDFDFYDDSHSANEHKDLLEDKVFFKLGYKETRQQQRLWKKKLNELYSFVHLSSCLDSLRTMFYNISEHISNYINFIEKVETYEANKYSMDEIIDNDPNNLKLEFKINKISIVFFYNILFESGIIDIYGINERNRNTNLRKYLDRANICYLKETGEVIPVKGITKEFAKIKNDKDGEYTRQEIELLDLIIRKFDTRKEKLIKKL